METIIYGLHDIQLPLYFSEILVFHLILYIWESSIYTLSRTKMCSTLSECNNFDYFNSWNMCYCSSVKDVFRNCLALFALFSSLSLKRHILPICMKLIMSILKYLSCTDQEYNPLLQNPHIHRIWQIWSDYLFQEAWGSIKRWICLDMLIYVLFYSLWLTVPCLLHFSTFAPIQTRAVFSGYSYRTILTFARYLSMILTW
jgi:hypothetical protein